MKIVQQKNAVDRIRSAKDNGKIDSKAETILLSYILSLYLESRLKPQFDSYFSKLNEYLISYYYE